ncbi:hypothetical protein JCM5296_000725 [Sporobolomyces johnsonii]
MLLPCLAHLLWISSCISVNAFPAASDAQQTFQLSAPAQTFAARPARFGYTRLVDLPDDYDQGLKNETNPLRNIQVHHPPIVPAGGKQCTVELLQHDFANSYYSPALAKYKPPTACGPASSWASIVLNLTVTSNGTQFDRLASLSLANVEIWRTSTAEPTRSGIIWTYEKDVSRFIPLFAESGHLIFELNNIVNERYTGIFSTTLSATFYSATEDFPAPASADLIIPLTTGRKKGSQMLMYPGDTSVDVKVPINTAEAWLEVIATGAADEEFWYTNVLDSYQYVYPDAGLIGKGPFREVELFIDGKLAGVVYPFPVIYTGGANPLLWRPLASLRAFDIPSFYIDVSPFLTMLTDGASHNFTFTILGQGEAGSINSLWFITGALHVVLDPTSPPVRTTGRMLEYSVTPLPELVAFGEVSKDKKRLTTTVKASRSVNILSLLKMGSGRKTVHFGQAAYFSNTQYYDDGGAYEQVEQSTSVITTSTHSGQLALRDTYTFPLGITTNYSGLPDSFSANLDTYAYNRALQLPLALGGRGKPTATRSQQEGWATITGRTGNFSLGFGETTERYSFWGERGETYEELTKAVNSTIASRKRGGSLAGRAGSPGF